LRTVTGWSQPGIASTGFSAPDSDESGGLTGVRSWRQL